MTPYVMIQFSDDGGETWSSEIKKPLINSSKNYLNRVVLKRGGQAYGRMYRLRYSDNSSFSLVEGFAWVSTGV